MHTHAENTSEYKSQAIANEISRRHVAQKVQRRGSGSGPGVIQAIAVVQLHKVVHDPKHWDEEETQELFRRVPELNALREALLGIDVENWTWDLKARCIALVREYGELETLIQKYIVAENLRRAQYGGLLRDLNPDDIEDHITMIAAHVRWTLKVIGSGEFDDEVRHVELHDQAKKSEDVGALVSTDQEGTGPGKGDKGIEGGLPVSSAEPRLVATPRLPATHVKKSAEENAKDLHQFEQNIAQLAIRMAATKPAVVEEHEQLIASKMAELSKVGDTTETGNITIAYNQLPPATADYWKEKVTHESLMEGLELIVKKARELKGYPVDYAKFNALFDSLIGREPAELLTAVQSLLRLAPNKQDLMETMVDGAMRDTTGINCGKTIGSGFNTALGELTPPESAVRALCNRANRRIIADVIAACLLKTKGRGDLPDATRRVLIGKILTATISGAGSIGALLPIVTPEAVRLIQDTLHAMYNEEGIAVACKLEISKLADASFGTADPSAAVAARVELERLSDELQLESMYALIGADFFDEFKVDVAPELLKKIAIGGGLLCVSSEGAEQQVELPVSSTSPAGADIVAPGIKSSYPKTLAAMVKLHEKLSAKDELYVEDGDTFTYSWGFYNQPKNVRARDKMRSILLTAATEVLRLYMPPAAVLETMLGIMGQLESITQERYTLNNAETDFSLVSGAVNIAIGLHNSEHNAFE